MSKPAAWQAIEKDLGERADDGLYAPSIDRVDRMVGAKGLLFVGDCKMSSLATRAHVRRLGHHYLAPLALVGETGREMPSWIDAAVSGSHALTPVYTRVDGHEPKLLGRGSEITLFPCRGCDCMHIAGMPAEES